jgi:hypothetical protein
MEAIRHLYFDLKPELACEHECDLDGKHDCTPNTNVATNLEAQSVNDFKCTHLWEIKHTNVSVSSTKAEKIAQWFCWVVALCVWFYVVNSVLSFYVPNVGLQYLMYSAGAVLISKMVFKVVTPLAACLAICAPLMIMGGIIFVGFLASFA